jgi:anti-anti-sigma factor
LNETTRLHHASAGAQRQRGAQNSLSPSFAFNPILNKTSPEELKLEVRSEVADGVTVYRIAGRIDASTSQNLESAVGSAVSGRSPRVMFDMREVTFITSAGLRIIVMMAKQAAAAKGGLAIFGLQPAVNEVFEIAGLQKIIPIASDETEARSKLGA